MIGNPGETIETIKDSIRFAHKTNPDGPNYFQFTTPNPGSRLYDESERYGVVTSTDYEYYTHTSPVFIPKGLDAKTMIKMRGLAMKRHLSLLDRVLYKV
jgi:radical SAM superfamily enzyme YgiQ (UPF0313 family)